MAYREIAPSAPLDQVVVCFWEVCNAASDETGAGRRIFPDGCFDVIVDLAGPPGDRAVMAVGPMTTAVVVPATPSDLFGIRFRPGPASRLFGPPLVELRDASVPAAVLLGSDARQLADRIAAARSASERVALASRFLTNRLAALDSTSGSRVAHAIGLVRQGGRVPDLAARLGLSSRHLERLFLRNVGLRPKEVIRLARFRTALARLRSGRPLHLSRLAHELGYADQSHFTREFRRFGGLPPSALARAGRAVDPGESDLFKPPAVGRANLNA